MQEENQRADVDIILDLLEDLEEAASFETSSVGTAARIPLCQASYRGEPGQVMTIHSAKGLEFDPVIVPQLQKETRTSERDCSCGPKRLGADGSLVLSIAAQPAKGECDALHKGICEEIDKKELHELGRLSYVACTRARNELLLFASVRTKKNGAECGKPSGTTFLG